MKTPVPYTAEIAAEILDRLAQGESLLSICRSPNMPSDVAVRKWALNDYNGFSAEYARARDIGADAMADAAVDAAITATDASTGRLKFDALRWHAGKSAPRRWGDKLQHANAAGDGDQVTKVVYTWGTSEKEE